MFKKSDNEQKTIISKLCRKIVVTRGCASNISNHFHHLKSKHVLEYEESKRMCPLQGLLALQIKHHFLRHFPKAVLTRWKLLQNNCIFFYLLLKFCTINVLKRLLHYMKYVLVIQLRVQQLMPCRCHTSALSLSEAFISKS